MALAVVKLHWWGQHVAAFVSWCSSMCVCVEFGGFWSSVKCACVSVFVSVPVCIYMHKYLLEWVCRGAAVCVYVECDGLCVFLSVCVCIYMYIYIWMYTYVYTYTLDVMACVSAISARMYLCVCVCVCVFMFTYVCVCICICIPMCMYRYMCI